MDRPTCGWCSKPAALKSEEHIVCKPTDKPTADTPRCKADLEKLTNQRITKITYGYSNEIYKLDSGEEEELIKEAFDKAGVDWDFPGTYAFETMRNKVKREVALDRWVVSYTTHDGESYRLREGNFCCQPCAVKFANASYWGGYRRG